MQTRGWPTAPVVGLSSLCLTLGLLVLVLWLSEPSRRSVAAAASSLYVAPSANCAGLSPCYASIQDAVDAAPGLNDQILVAAGSYTDIHARNGLSQVVAITKSVQVLGGYTTTNNFAVADPTANPTVLDARGKGRVVTIVGPVTATVAGLQITGGQAPSGTGVVGIGYSTIGGYGGGVYILSATATLSGNLITKNAAIVTGTFLSGYGGGQSAGAGVYAESAAVTLQGNTISSNVGRGADAASLAGYVKGGGVFLQKATAAILANVIASNTITGGTEFTRFPSDSSGGFAYGGGVAVENSTATFQDNAILNNRAFGGNGNFGSDAFPGRAFGGGLSVVDSVVSVTHDLISGNSVTGGLELTPTFGSPGSGFTVGGGVSASAIFSKTAITLARTRILGNAAASGARQASVVPGTGGGLAIANAVTALLVNTVVADNRADAGSGIDIVGGGGTGSTAALLHTTIARNLGQEGSGLLLSGVSVALTNTILVSQTVGITATTGTTTTVNAILWASTTVTSGGAGTVSVANQVTGDPAFAPDGYHLTAGSAAIGKGVDGGVPIDLDGSPRPLGAPPDLGAVQYASGSPPGEKIFVPVSATNYASGW